MSMHRSVLRSQCCAVHVTCHPTFYVPTTPIFPNSNFWALVQTCLDPLFCLPGPSWLVHHLAHPSAHLHTPPCTSAHLCTPSHTLPCTSAHLHAPLCNFLH